MLSVAVVARRHTCAGMIDAVTQPNDEPVLFTPIPDPRPHDQPWPQMRWPVPARTRLAGRTIIVAPSDPDADAAGLFRALDHDVVWANVDGRPASPEAMADSLHELAARDGWQVWTVRLADLSGQVVGTTAFLDASVPDARVELGRTLYAPQVWGGAVNAEAKLLLLGHAFDTLGAGRVQLKTDTRNVRSQQAIARLGAHYEGTLRRHHRRADGTVRDSVLFSIIAEEWPEVRRTLTKRLGRLR